MTSSQSTAHVQPTATRAWPELAELTGRKSRPRPTMPRPEPRPWYLDAWQWSAETEGDAAAGSELRETKRPAEKPAPEGTALRALQEIAAEKPAAGTRRALVLAIERAIDNDDDLAELRQRVTTAKQERVGPEAFAELVAEVRAKPRQRKPLFQPRPAETVREDADYEDVYDRFAEVFDLPLGAAIEAAELAAFLGKLAEARKLQPGNAEDEVLHRAALDVSNDYAHQLRALTRSW